MAEATGMCYRCKRTDTPRHKVTVQTEAMDEPEDLEACVEQHRLACLSESFGTGVQLLPATYLEGLQ